MNKVLQFVASENASRKIKWVACFFLGAILLCYLGLIGLGRWQLDEFVQSYRAVHNQHYILDRLKWSPRIFSEPLYYFYGLLVNALHLPLTVPLLGILWLFFISAGLFTVWQEYRRVQYQQASRILCLALSLMVLFLSGSRATEIFYWPAGAVAYMPTLAAILLLFLQVIDERLATPGGRPLASICLLVAAGSSEAGAVFTFSFAIVQGLRWSWMKWRKNACSPLRLEMWWIVPAAMTMAVLFTIWLYRWGSVELAGTPQFNAHISVASAVYIGFRQMLMEFIGIDVPSRLKEYHALSSGWSHPLLRLCKDLAIHSRLPMEMALATGVALLWSRHEHLTKEQACRIAGLVTALLMTSWVLIVSANRHFGFTCCERHQNLRESWGLMSIAGLVIVSLVFFGQKRLKQLAALSSLAPLLFCMAVLFSGGLKKLEESYEAYGMLWETAKENFQSGYNASEKHMILWVLPSVGVIDQSPMKPGDFTRPDVVPDVMSLETYPYHILYFFDKQTITIKPLRLEQAQH